MAKFVSSAPTHFPPPRDFFFFGLAAGGILVPLPGMEPVSPTVEAQSLNYWTTREVPRDYLEANPKHFISFCKHFSSNIDFIIIIHFFMKIYILAFFSTRSLILFWF